MSWDSLYFQTIYRRLLGIPREGIYGGLWGHLRKVDLGLRATAEVTEVYLGTYVPNSQAIITF